MKCIRCHKNTMFKDKKPPWASHKFSCRSCGTKQYADIKEGKVLYSRINIEPFSDGTVLCWENGELAYFYEPGTWKFRKINILPVDITEEQFKKLLPII